MALSEQLTDLANRTKRLEDTAASAEKKDREKLQMEREKLHAAMQSEANKVKSSAQNAKTEANMWWADITSRAEEQRKDLHDKIEQRKAERQIDKAVRQADDAEDYAVNMIQVALYCVDAADYAVADAVIARTKADEMVAAG